MMTYSMTDFLKGQPLVPTLQKHKAQFEKRFGLVVDSEIEVELTFDSYRDATDFYQEVKYNPTYAMYAVSTTDHVSKLRLRGNGTLFDLFGSREPNILTISRNLEITLHVSYTQPYSGHVFTGDVVNGELLSRHLLIEVNAVVPELALGSLGQFASTEQEFETLLTRIYYAKAVSLL